MTGVKLECWIYLADKKDINFKEFVGKFQEFLIVNGYEFDGKVIKGQIDEW